MPSLLVYSGNLDLRLGCIHLSHLLVLMKPSSNLNHYPFHNLHEPLLLSLDLLR